MGLPGGMEWIIIAFVVLLLFGGKKIPELAKGLGQGIKNFKSAVKEDEPAVESTEKIEETATTTTVEKEETKTTTTA